MIYWRDIKLFPFLPLRWRNHSKTGQKNRIMPRFRSALLGAWSVTECSAVKPLLKNTWSSTPESLSFGAASVNGFSSTDVNTRITWTGTKGSPFLVRHALKDTSQKLHWSITSRNTLGSICTDVVFAIRGLMININALSMKLVALLWLGNRSLNGSFWIWTVG